MSCSALREEFVQCLLQSNCIKVERKTAKECMQPDSDVPNECKSLQKAFFECKRGQLDMRNRFRGNKNAI